MEDQNNQGGGKSEKPKPILEQIKNQKAYVEETNTEGGSGITMYKAVLPKEAADWLKTIFGLAVGVDVEENGLVIIVSFPFTNNAQKIVDAWNNRN